MKLFDELLIEYDKLLWDPNRDWDPTFGLDTVQIDVSPEGTPSDTVVLKRIAISENERALYYLLHGYRDQIVESMSAYDFVDGGVFQKAFRSGYVVESKDGIKADNIIYCCLSHAPIFWLLFDKYFQIDAEAYTFKKWKMTPREEQFEWGG